MPELEFVGIAAKGECRELVAHADPEDGQFPEAFFYCCDRLFCLLGIPGPVGDKEAVGFAPENIVMGGIVGEDIQVAFSPGQAREHIGLEAEVDDGHPFSFPGNAVGCLAGYGGDQVAVRYGGGLFREFHRIFAIIAADNECCTHRAVDPGLDGQAAGIHPGHPKQFLLLEKVPDRGFCIGYLADLAADCPEDLGFLALHVLHIDTVVPDGREREHQDLAGITGIGERLHVPGHQGVEDKFTGTFALNTESIPYNILPILKTQNRLHFRISI